MIELLGSLLSASNLLTLFGRAGGGGSGGDSDDGGSIFILLGYLPMHFLGSRLKKKLSIGAASAIGWPVAFIYGIIWIVVFGIFGLFVALVALIGIGAGLYDWFNKIANLAKKAKNDQAVAVQKDSTWDANLLNNRVNEVFLKYQSDWSNNDFESMKAYMSPLYAERNRLMIYALMQLRRRNLVGQPTILSQELVEVADNDDNAKDSFTMYITARAVDDLMDIKTNELIFRDTRQFQEYWKFARNANNEWILDEIRQATEDSSKMNVELMSFATSKNYFFSPDWGWLLLPRRGQLFSSGKFGVSDINNHVIGIYNGVLIQLYSYIPKPLDNSNVSTKSYIIAQVALPKYYGNIVVRRKKAFSFGGIRGLTKVSMEWGDFNKKYEVFASDMERVTSFELLNPSFMVKLEALPFEVNIEVVDNVAYLYGEKIVPNLKNYEIMLQILQHAFKEMKM